MRALLACLGITLVAVLLAPSAAANDPATKKTAKPIPAVRVTSAQVDALVRKEVAGSRELLNDEEFLRRVTLDMLGRLPTEQEQNAFLGQERRDRAKLIDRVLANPDFGKHWANYWCDTIRYRVPPPELTFLSYEWFKPWLAERFNKNEDWGSITRAIVSASGNVKKNPAATFVGYHQGNSSKLAAETARIFLGVQIQCAECHDHKFDHWKRNQFHELAAFFGKASGKLGKAQDGSSTEVSESKKGQHLMPNVKNPRQKGEVMVPVFLTGAKLELTTSDRERREALGRWLTDKDNPWFARAYTNRIWAQMMGRGFYDPVDDLADYRYPLLPAVHRALAGHFNATGYDPKDMFRVLLNTETYQRQTRLGVTLADKNQTTHNKLNGDEVFQALEQALGLPDVRPAKMKPTAEIRFPPPPKSTRDIIAEKFGFDPSLCPEEISRTLGQAMQLMNNTQIQAQINADPKSGTLLSKLLRAERDNQKLFVRLFRQTLARTPNDREVSIAMEHLNEVGDRGQAFEDLLWSLINTAEFTSRR